MQYVPLSCELRRIEMFVFSQTHLRLPSSLTRRHALIACLAARPPPGLSMLRRWPLANLVGTQHTAIVPPLLH